MKAGCIVGLVFLGGIAALGIIGVVWLFNSVQGHQLEVENRTAQTITVGAEDGVHYFGGHIRAGELGKIEGVDFVGKPNTIVIQGHGFSETCDFKAAKDNEPLVIDGVRPACSSEIKRYAPISPPLTPVAVP